MPWTGQYLTTEGAQTISTYYGIPVWVNVLVMAFFYALAVIVHERQHLNTLRRFGVTPKVQPLCWYKPLTYQITWEGSLTVLQQQKVYAYAILAGAGIAASSILFNNDLGYIILGFYFAGCIHDFKALKALREQEDNPEENQ